MRRCGYGGMRGAIYLQSSGGVIVMINMARNFLNSLQYAWQLYAALSGIILMIIVAVLASNYFVFQIYYKDFL